MKLHHLLQQEADELKRLLGAKAGVVGDQPAAAVKKSTRATLARLKTDLVSRRLHEAGVSTSEVCNIGTRTKEGNGNTLFLNLPKACLHAIFSMYKCVSPSSTTSTPD